MQPNIKTKITPNSSSLSFGEGWGEVIVASGLPYQYFFYSPWGEALKDEKASTGSWNSPYKFNGKEQDEESGLYYYGARYYNPHPQTGPPQPL